MSGLEVAGLGVGILLPLVVEAVKGYSTTRKQLKTYRAYSNEVRRLYDHFGIQRDNYLNECQLLLQDLVGDDVEDMLEDCSHDRWKDRDLAERIKKRLENNYDNCVRIMMAVKEALEEVAEELKPFEVLLSEKEQGESFKSTIKRLRKRILIPFRKPELEKEINTLKSLNEDFAVLHSYIRRFRQQRREFRSSALIQQEKLPKQYGAVQNAARTLHEALMTSWRCDNPMHSKHGAILCLQAQPSHNNRVSLDMAISFEQSAVACSSSNAVEPLLWLQIQSSIINVPTAAPIQGRKHLQKLTDALQNESSTLNLSSKRSKTEATSDVEEPKKRKKAVRFADGASDGPVQPLGAPTNTDSIHVDSSARQLKDLRKEHDICQHLKKSICVPRDGSEHCVHCLGFLETPLKAQHLFYCPGLKTVAGQPLAEPLPPNRSVADLLTQTPHDQFEADNKLNLALRLAKATLQYSSTPWLDDAWYTQNIFLLGSQPDFSDAALQTLHLKADFPDRDCNGAFGPRPMDFSPDLSVLELQYGIRNMSLFSLGVALMEIGREGAVHFRDGEDQVVTVRKLAHTTNGLGARYKEIIRRCLECDFGFGNDLSKPDLQNAVYGQVVCELEGMMKKLCIA
ncbi:uncharacterized protein K452DRAFT_242384 [Aplosporella prunicola CBS 121167]|uniref:DUF7580 domain-containing protein n=1 Tax=Aplosporella prunicola CBS 121167 TaxID=1176127 RepID=A0A6A6BRX0_9PEZI|nr:uncharacterized protein K452DRAFT_242384 [Aplosporella prunicola CBS 121167]KAF2145964.1 hypothetical protein K452DRAFT_242384 [Aplosporella prunicola CBS 121167]